MCARCTVAPTFRAMPSAQPKAATEVSEKSIGTRIRWNSKPSGTVGRFNRDADFGEFFGIRFWSGSSMHAESLEQANEQIRNNTSRGNRQNPGPNDALDDHPIDCA